MEWNLDFLAASCNPLPDALAWSPHGNLLAYAAHQMIVLINQVWHLTLKDTYVI